MGMFSFLKDLSLETPATTPRTLPGAASKSPVDADLRVFTNGSIFPSQALVDTMNLQYTHKEDAESGNAFDIIDSRIWPQYPKGPQQAVFIALVPRSAPKTDLFSMCKYNPDGTPFSDVMTQGSASYGKELLDMLASVYEVTVEQMLDGKSYVDLLITTDCIPAATNGMYWFPKTVSRGPKKGELEITRRENCNPHALVFRGISAEFPRQDGTYLSPSEVVVTKPHSSSFPLEEDPEDEDSYNQDLEDGQFGANHTL